MEQLIVKINDDEINAKIIQCASEAEYNLIHGRRDITHIDYFVSGVMRELLQHKPEVVNKKKSKKIVVV
jgi:replication factor C subunit 3/5